MELKTVRDGFDRVAKKQKLSTSKFQEVIDQVSDEIKQALMRIQSVDHPSISDRKSALTDLELKLKTISPLEQLQKSQEELNMNLSKFPKILYKVLNPNISRADKNVDFNCHIVNQIILSQLYCENLFDVVDSLVNEAEEPEPISLRCQFAEMHQILEAVRARNLDPALRWVLVNSQKLKQRGSSLEPDVHQLQFVEMLQKRNQAKALGFAQICLSRFASNHM